MLVARLYNMRGCMVVCCVTQRYIHNLHTSMSARREYTHDDTPHFSVPRRKAIILRLLHDSRSGGGLRDM